MAKKFRQNSFWKQARTRFKLSLFNENTLEEVLSFRLSALGTAIVASLLVLAIIGGTYVLIAITPIKNLIPGYTESNVRAKMLENSMRVDSLERAAHLQAAYVNGIRNILSGELSFDSIPQIDSLIIFPSDSLLDRSKITDEFIKRFEAEEKYTLTVFNNTIPMDGLVFYAPIKGAISVGFDPIADQFGVSILAPRNAGISSVLDGTVISAYYTIEAGYVIQVQHTNDFISVYKYNASLLKEVGDKVIGGEKIALVGSSPLQPATAMLEFQLWHKGQAIDPLQYIIF